MCFIQLNIFQTEFSSESLVPHVMQATRVHITMILQNFAE
jgi:hypothetical protein